MDNREALSNTGGCTDAALRAYFRIARLWKLTFREQRLLLGDPSFWQFFRWKLTHTGSPGTDVMQRISYVFGIFKALAVLLPVPSSANRWIRQPNSHPLFGGRSALVYALDEGMIGLHRVRSYVDSQHADGDSIAKDYEASGQGHDYSGGTGK